MSRTKELVKNTLIISLGKLSTQIISFILLPLYTDKLLPEEYGNYDFIVSISVFLVPIITMLLEESMFRFLIDAENNDEKEKIISHTFIYNIISILLSIIVLFAFFKVFNYDLGKYIIVYTISSTFVALANALARGEGKMTLFSVANFTLSLLTIILSVIFILVFKFGFISLVMASVIANISVSLFVFVKLNIIQYISFKSFDLNYLVKMLKYSIPLVPNTICWSVINLSDRLFILNYLGAATNGIYSIAYKFPNILNNFYSYFNTAWRETSARIANDGNQDEEYKRIFEQIKRVLFSICIILIAFMPLLFPIFIDYKYLPGLIYVPILAISVYYTSISGFYGGIFTAFKDTKILGFTSFIAGITNLVVNIIFIKRIGVMAAAISTLISSLIIYEFRRIKLRKYIKIDNYKNDLYILFVFCLICFCFYIKKLNIIGMLLSIIISFYLNINFIKKSLQVFKNKILKQRK